MNTYKRKTGFKVCHSNATRAATIRAKEWKKIKDALAGGNKAGGKGKTVAAAAGGGKVGLVQVESSCPVAWNRLVSFNPCAYNVLSWFLQILLLLHSTCSRYSEGKGVAKDQSLPTTHTYAAHASSSNAVVCMPGAEAARAAAVAGVAGAALAAAAAAAGGPPLVVSPEDLYAAITSQVPPDVMLALVDAVGVVTPLTGVSLY
jgi:hypothetical protein